MRCGYSLFVSRHKSIQMAHWQRSIIGNRRNTWMLNSWSYTQSSVVFIGTPEVLLTLLHASQHNRWMHMQRVPCHKQQMPRALKLYTCTQRSKQRRRQYAPVRMKLCRGLEIRERTLNARAVGCSGTWCLRMWVLKLMVGWPSTIDCVGTSHRKLIWVGFESSTLKPHILQHHIPEHPKQGRCIVCMCIA